MKNIDYYFAPNSPWAYLGHQRFAEMARAAGASIRVLPVDLGQVFPVSGGLPLAKRAPQRQAYRLVELRRFSEFLGIPLTLQPRFFPVAADPAARLITAVDQLDGPEPAMRLAGATLAAVWAQERNIADDEVLAALLQEQGLPRQRLADSQQEAVQERYQARTRDAIELGVFGSPTYVVDGEMFWGQDRLDFLARKLQAAAR